MIINIGVIKALHSSFVYVKGVNSRKCSFRQRKCIIEHIKLWNMIYQYIVNRSLYNDIKDTLNEIIHLNQFNYEEISDYILKNKYLKKTISIFECNKYKEVNYDLAENKMMIHILLFFLSHCLVEYNLKSDLKRIISVSSITHIHEKQH